MASGEGVGLQKSKKYKWKETNLALFGSELEKKVLLTCSAGPQSMSFVKTRYVLVRSADQEGECGMRGCVEGRGYEGGAPDLEDRAVQSEL